MKSTLLAHLGPSILALCTMFQLAQAAHRPSSPTDVHHAQEMAVEPTLPQATAARLPLMPLAFTENKGQWDERVKFRASASGATIWFTTDGIYYQFTRRISQDDVTSDDWASAHQMSTPAPSERLDRQPDSIEQLVIKASFAGANPDVEFVGEGLMDYKCNYFIGNDPSNWRADVASYETVTMLSIYEGVDLRFHSSSDGRLAYQYSFASEAAAGQIKTEYDGLAELSQDENGRITLNTAWGEIKGVLAPPDDDALDFGGFLPSPSFTLQHEAEESPSGQGRTQAVELVYSTYLGGSGTDQGFGITVDADGNAYVTGVTASTNFPTVNPYQTDQVGHDAFVAKLNAYGSNLIYSTYLGGGDYESGRSIAVDAEGYAYVTGTANSADFPTVDPYQTHQGGQDAFVAKLNPTGNDLVYSTYLGGNAGDIAYDIAVDTNGNAYVTGATSSGDFPTVDPYQTHQTGSDAFVTKLNSSGNDLVYSTCLGGSGGGGWLDLGLSIAVDVEGNAYVTGITECIDYPTVNAYQTDPGDDNSDAFATKLNPAGNNLVYSTYLGGDAHDEGYGIAVDAEGSAYVAGYTGSADFPAVNPYQSDQDTVDVFVAKLNPAGNDLMYSTYLGGDADDRCYDIAVDVEGNASVTGYTKSADFPTQDAWNAVHNGNKDAFVTKLSAEGDSLIYSTFLGDWDQVTGRDIALDAYGGAYATVDGSSVIIVKLALAVAYVCGDADASGERDIDDVVFLIAYIFSGGPEPVPYESGDADCSGGVDIDDVVYLISYIFSGGNAPCDTDGDGVPDC